MPASTSATQASRRVATSTSPITEPVRRRATKVSKSPLRSAENDGAPWSSRQRTTQSKRVASAPTPAAASGPPPKPIESA